MNAVVDRLRLSPTMLMGAVVLLAAGYVASKSAPGTVGHFDTVTYVNTAEHVCAGHGWMTSRATDDTGEPAPLTQFGPGFSALLAVPCITGVHPRDGIPWVMGASLVAYALATFWLLLLALDRSRSWRAAFIAGVSTLALIVQGPVLASTASILSDLPGAALTLVCVCLVSQRRFVTQRGAVVLGVALAATIMVRWGLASFCVFLGLVAMARACSAWDRARQIKHLLWAPAIVTITVGSWLARNFALTGKITGTRQPANEDPVEIVLTALRGIGSILRPAHQYWQAHDQREIYTLALVGSLGLLAAWLSVATPATRQRPMLGLVACGYFLALVLTRSQIAFDSLASPRFWLAEWSILAAAIANCLQRPSGVRLLRLATLTAWAAVAFLVTLPAISGMAAQAESPRRPSSVAPPLTATTREAIRLHDQGRCTLASNDARLLLPHTGVRIVRWFPTRGPKLARITEPDRLPTCLVAFAASYRPRSAAEEDRRVRQTMSAMASRGDLRRLSSERGIELWITVPRARE